MTFLASSSRGGGNSSPMSLSKTVRTISLPTATHPMDICPWYWMATAERLAPASGDKPYLKQLIKFQTSPKSLLVCLYLNSVCAMLSPWASMPSARARRPASSERCGSYNAYSLLFGSSCTSQMSMASLQLTSSRKSMNYGVRLHPRTLPGRPQRCLL